MSSSIGCEECLRRGVVYTTGVGKPCTSCEAPPVSESLAFTTGNTTCIASGYGTDVYTIGDQWESVDLTRDEVRAVIAHMQAWLDK